MNRPFRPRLRIKSDYIATLAVALAPVVYFLPAISEGVVLCPDDGTIFNTPLRVAIAQIVWRGDLPLWNPYIFSGMPLFAAAQGAILYPLNWFYLAFPAPLATNLMVVSSYLVAGVGAYLYARSIRLSIGGAIVTSLIWQFGGVLIGQIAHINILHSEIILPWILWALENYVSRQSKKWGCLIAAFVALQALAGNLQTFVYSLMLVFAYALLHAYFDKKTRAYYLSSLALVAAGVMLAAVQIVPTFEMLRNSLRSTASYDFFTAFSARPSFIRTFLAPYIAGGGDGRLFKAPYVGEPYYGEMIAYAGILGVVLAITAIVWQPDRRTKFWAVVGLIGLLLAFGRFLPFEIYRLIYHVPILNLFRVPARHLMEVNFALAVLAGRGYTMLSNRKEGRWRALVVAVAVFILTWVVVIWARPANFRLGREAELSFLRAPEIFMPVLFAGLSAMAIWFFRRSRNNKGAVLVVALLALDLILWGHSSGWRVSSPKSDGELFREPGATKFLREREGTGSSNHYRVLTLPHSFEPGKPLVPPSVSGSGRWVLGTQPDVYMMPGIHNAAGYDGFGLSRYSRLAGDMKVWGELTDPERTFRTGSREIDLLNVKYVVAMTPSADDEKLSNDASALVTRFPKAPLRHGDYMFSASDLGIILAAKKRALFSVPAVKIDAVALVTSLSWSEQVTNETEVARLRLITQDGKVHEFPIRAGRETSEWAIDRPDIKSRVKHDRATIASSYEVNDGQLKYQAHSYLCSFDLPVGATIVAGELATTAIPGAPEISTTLLKLSFVDKATGRSYPLRRDWVSPESEERELTANTAGGWEFRTRINDVEIYENLRPGPRVWLASNALRLDDESMLGVIRTGYQPDGRAWDPRVTALVEAEPPIQPQASGESRVEIVRYETNRIDLKTTSTGAAILVLSENHYPGWRAYVDDTAVETMRVNYNLRGVALPAGNHDVTFVYRPKSVLIGLLMTLTTLAVLAFWYARGKRSDFPFVTGKGSR